MGDVEDKYNAKKSRTLKSCKLLLRKKKNCHKNKQRLIFFLLTKIVVLIHTHMEIKPTVTVTHGSIFRIFYIPMWCLILIMMTGCHRYLSSLESEYYLESKNPDNWESWIRDLLELFTESAIEKCLTKGRVLQKTVVQCSWSGTVLWASSLFYKVLDH